MKLTDKIVDRLKHNGTKKDGSPKQTPDKYLDSDCPGLMIVVRASGKKTWVLRKKVNGRTVESKLGEFGRADAGAMNCRLARQEFFKLQHVISDGVAEHVAKRRRDRTTGAMTMGEMIETYRDQYGVPVLGWEWGTISNCNDRVSACNKTPQKSLAVNTLTKADASKLFKHLREDRHYSRRRLREFFGTLSRSYIYVTDEDLIDDAGANVFDWCLRMRVMKLPVEKDYRDYVMTDREIRILWSFKPFKGSVYESGDRIPGGQESDPLKALEAQTIFKLLLMTGIRVGEIRNSRWSDWENSEVVRNPDTNRKVRVPMLRVYEHKMAKKTLHPLYIPLAGPVIELLLAYQEERRSNSTWVFPILSGRDFKDRRRRAGGTAIAQQISRELNAKEGTSFKLHDIRTAVATRLGDMGYTSELIGKILNHSSDKQSTTGKHYNHSQYLLQKMEMYTAWLSELHRIINCENEEILDLGNNRFSQKRFSKTVARISKSDENVK
ncbi:MAG: hypothetical protein CL524_11650 [Aequorivita sp.]|nr:hypothetical protein [Aequorivita sp.]